MNPSYYDVVGDVIRSQREALGMTQGQLARRSGLEQSQLSRVEHGERPLRLEQFAALADALETSARHLYERVEARFVEVYQAEDPEERRGRAVL